MDLVFGQRRGDQSSRLRLEVVRGLKFLLSVGVGRGGGGARKDDVMVQCAWLKEAPQLRLPLACESSLTSVHPGCLTHSLSPPLRPGKRSAHSAAGGLFCGLTVVSFPLRTQTWRSCSAVSCAMTSESTKCGRPGCCRTTVSWRRRTSPCRSKCLHSSRVR